MHFLLPLLYATVFSFLIFRLNLFRDEKLPRLFFVIIFLLKAFLGILYINVFMVGDAVLYFHDADSVIYPTLWHAPLKYFYLTFGPNGGKIPEFVVSEVTAMGYWGDTSDYTVVRFNALVRLFSFGNFYVHAVFMSFVSLLGMIWLYRAYILATGNFSRPIVATIFLIPSVLFWSSGVHKEGLLLFALGLFIYGCVLLIQHFSIKNLLLALAGTALTYFIRNYVLLLLLPGMVAFFATYRNYLRIRFLLPLIYIVIIGAGTLLPLFGGKNFTEVIAIKQEEFKSLKEGNTHIPVKDFEPSFISLLTNLPQALRNSLFGPFLISPEKIMHYLIIVENVFLLLALLLFPLISGRPRLDPFTLMCLLFSISLLILIGYIVPNVGAIVRYRSIALPFLFIFIFSGNNALFSSKS